MNSTKTLGLALFIFSFGLFIVSVTLSSHVLTDEALAPMKKYQGEMLKQVAADAYGKKFSSNIEFIAAIKPLLEKTRDALDKACGIDPSNNVWNATTLPEGVAEWDYRMSDYDVKFYVATLTKTTAIGLLPNNAGLFFFLIFILGSIGALMYIVPDVNKIPGIKNNRIYHSSIMKGIIPVLQMIVVSISLFITFFIMLKEGEQSRFYLYCTVLFTALVIGMIFLKERKERKVAWGAGKSTIGNGWIGVTLGTFLILFYIVLYFYPYYISNWVLLVDPIKKTLSGGKPADRWFLYGFLYCLVMVVMGIRMIIKYRHNKYQLVRTGSVLFFQLGFAFLLPEILGRLNNPAVNLMTPWPLDYSFYYDYRLNDMLVNNDNYFLGMNVGTSMFIWGVFLTLVLVPLFTYLFGKRWYCSWVCGCGGLAETLGDPFRQLSDKSLRAWRIERYVIHVVMVFVTFMTALVIYHYMTGTTKINLGFHEFDVYEIRTWYGFLIGSVFAGVVGTGFYPLMGNRMWCRYGCPLAGLMGIVQRFKSRFRITTNGGQCISCGNCSTYCEMGIDVRAYAQRGQDIIRASCVGCGICSAVCPRGVLRLENSGLDIANRALDVRNLHVKMDDVKTLTD
ncbi:MAG: 4Fe-4S binding protein [Saprospiraceae bacterium]|nr:4Fe-4S binding protein [Saprospiraceae bacterium]